MGVLLLSVGTVALLTSMKKSSDRFKVKTKAEKGCVFLSVFEAEGIDSNFI